jgi:type II secretory pathway pseudopilin PulG
MLPDGIELVVVVVLAAASFALSRWLSRGWRRRRAERQQELRRAGESRQVRRARERRNKTGS